MKYIFSFESIFLQWRMTIPKKNFPQSSFPQFLPPKFLYEPKFKQVKSQLETKFPKNKSEIIGRKVPGGVGTFEVEIEGVKLLHSKRKGQGFVDSPEKLDKIIEEIEMALVKS